MEIMKQQLNIKITRGEMMIKEFNKENPDKKETKQKVIKEKIVKG